MGDSFNKVLPQSQWFATLMGKLGEFTTMVGNAAGEVMSIFPLVKNLPNKEIVGKVAKFVLP